MFAYTACFKLNSFSCTRNVFRNNWVNREVSWWAATFSTSSCRPTRRHSHGVNHLQSQSADVMLLLSIDPLTRVSRCERLSSEICKRFNEHFNWLYDYIIKSYLDHHHICSMCSYTLINVIKVSRWISAERRHFVTLLAVRIEIEVDIRLKMFHEGVNGVIETLEHIEPAVKHKTSKNSWKILL